VRQHRRTRATERYKLSMTTTTSAPRRPGSPKSLRDRVQDRLQVAKINGGAACAEPRGNGRFTVHGRTGNRYTCVIVDRETIICDCRSGLYHGPSSCWHSACAFLRAIADGAVA
jgi:hypothetical protein